MCTSTFSLAEIQIDVQACSPMRKYKVTSIQGYITGLIDIHELVLRKHVQHNNFIQAAG